MSSATKELRLTDAQADFVLITLKPICDSLIKVLENIETLPENTQKSFKDFTNQWSPDNILEELGKRDNLSEKEKNVFGMLKKGFSTLEKLDNYI